MPTFSFANTRAFHPIHHRPFAGVRIVDPISGKRSLVYDCLVDTGSDFTILPTSALTGAGLSPTGGTTKVKGIGGSVTLTARLAFRL